MRAGMLAVALAMSVFMAPVGRLVSAQDRLQDVKPETAKIRLSVGGQASIYYLPLTVTDRLGYFKQAGLDVEITDLQGGARALQALMGGSADVVTGAYDHTIQMHAKGQPILAVVQLGRFPGFALGIVASKVPAYSSPRDLKGMKIGVTAPGSSTHFMAATMMVRNGLRADDASFIGVGVSSTAIAAVRRGEIDAIVSSDPMVSLMEGENLIKVVADTRTPEGTRAVYGGPYPAAVLYTTPAFVDKNPRTVQALVNAFVRALRWIAGHSTEDIVNIVPEEYTLGDKATYLRAIAASRAMYSPDGRFTREGAETTLRVLTQFDASVTAATIEVGRTYSEIFVAKALATN